MALTKAALAARLVEAQGLDPQDAASLVNDVFETFRATLAQGQEVKLSGFGHFQLRDKNARPGLNPKTGEPIPVSARRVVTFKAGQILKQQVARYQTAPQPPVVIPRTDHAPHLKRVHRR